MKTSLPPEHATYIERIWDVQKTSMTSSEHLMYVNVLCPEDRLLDDYGTSKLMDNNYSRTWKTHLVVSLAIGIP